MELGVIGGSGFLGSHLLTELRSRNCSIRLITSDSAKRRKNSATAGDSVVSVSFEEGDQLAGALSGCTAIVYLSGINRERKPGDFEKVHVHNLAKIIEAANKLSIRKLVYVSFLKARPGTVSKYLQSKWDGEMMLRASTLDYTILKPGICFGPGDQMISSIVRGLQITPLMGIFAAVGIRERGMRPVHAKDMAFITAEALLGDRLSRQTNLVLGPEELTLSEAVKRVARVVKKKVLIINFPVSVMFALAWLLERVMPDSLVTVSQIKMLSDGLSDDSDTVAKLSQLSEVSRSAEDLVPLPLELKPKTYFTEQEISVAMGQIS